MSNNTASSVVFHDANEFAMYELSCYATCPVLSCLSLILVEHPSSLPAINTGGKLPAKPNSATLPAYPLTNFRLPYHTSYRPVRFISRSLSECRIQRVLAASPNPLSKSDVSNLLKGHRGRLLTSSFTR